MALHSLPAELGREPGVDEWTEDMDHAGLGMAERQNMAP